MTAEHMTYVTSNYSGDFVQNITDNTCVSTIPIVGPESTTSTSEPLYILRVNHNKDIAITRTIRAKELGLPYLSFNHHKELNILFLDSILHKNFATMYSMVTECAKNIEEIKLELIDTERLAFSTGETVHYAR